LTSGGAVYALTDAREFSFSHHLYPNVRVGFALPEARPVQWLVRHGAPDLLASVNKFFHDLEATGALAGLIQQSSGDTRRFAYEESREFQTHLGDRLPAYRSWFEQAAARSGTDWRLLAAIGYQESKWDARAESGDGARGVMMLTADTAHAMGIKDRSNPQQSIFAGARYLAQVRAMVPERVPEPDRTWLTVAAYNVGFGHLEDARILAQAFGKTPTPGPRCERACRCSRRSAGTRAPGAATPAAGSRCNTSIASSVISGCWNGSRARRCRAALRSPTRPLPGAHRLRTQSVTEFREPEAQRHTPRARGGEGAALAR